MKTRVLIISDTHCAALSKKHGDPSTYPMPPFESPLPPADLLIHCGDLTHTGKEHQYHQCLDMLKLIDAPVKLVIAGNHDFTLDKDFLLAHRESRVSEDKTVANWQRMRDLWTAPSGRAKAEGITFLDEGVHLINLSNGAAVNVYANPYTPEFYDWGFPYERDEDRFSSPKTSLADAKNIVSKPVPSFNSSERPIDVLLTHGPPWQIMDKTDSNVYAGCPHLLRALMRSRPLLHCFGHIHEGWGAQRIGWSAEAETLSTSAKQTIEQWGNGGGWRAGVADNGKAISSIPADDLTMNQKHAAFADISATGEQTLRRGQETLLVNAAIMDVKYKPVNAPWVIDMDLPRKT